jgi:hypothetical protein
MPNVRVAKISVDDQAWLHDTYFHDMTCMSIGIWTTGSEFFEEQHCLVILICIKKRDGLKYAMRQRVYEATVAYLDQEQEMNGLWILVSVHGCNIKCCPRIPDVALSAEGNTLGDKAYQRGLDADGLCHH